MLKTVFERLSPSRFFPLFLSTVYKVIQETAIMFRPSIFALCLGTCTTALAMPIARANPMPAPLQPFDLQLAQNTPPSRPVRRGGGDLIDQLDLNNSQKRQMAAIRQKYQGQMSQLRDRLRTSQNDLAALMASSSTDSAIRAKHREITGLREQLGNLRLDSILEMRQVLTPEQRNKLSQLMKERRPQGRRWKDRPAAPLDENS